MSNYNSCYDTKAYKYVTENILEEILDGRLTLIDDKPTCIHVMGIIEKELGRGGGVRKNTDCSQADRTSVDQFINDIFEPFHFVRIQEIISSISAGMWLSSIDLRSAYRSVAIFPDDRQYFGIHRRKQDGSEIVLQDNFLCFGTTTAPFISNILSVFYMFNIFEALKLAENQ